MNRRTPLACAALCVLTFTLGTRPTSAQTAQTVVGSAAISATQGQTRLMATIGQPAIGVISAPTAQGSQGFWSARSAAPASAAQQSVAEASLSLVAAPNPLSRSTTLTFTVQERAHVSLILFNSVGKQVGTILDEERNSGTVAYRADLSGLPSGPYTVMLRIGEQTASTTLMLVE